MSHRKARILAFDNQSVLLALISVRLLNTVTLKTFFQPDEYYQALEPAWNFVPGHDGAWITWEWTQHLRSAIHPAFFSLTYYIGDLLSRVSSNPDVQHSILLLAPKAAQSVVAALGDYYTWRLAENMYDDPELAGAALCLTVLNPWQWFVSTRTFSNGFENTLTIAALRYWPFDWHVGNTSVQPRATHEVKSPPSREADSIKRTTNDLRKSLVLAATATIMRPTNIIVWMTLASITLLQYQPQAKASTTRSKNDDKIQSGGFMSRFMLLTREVILCGGTVLAISAAIDRAFYGSWTFPALNFLYFNVVQSLAVFYGNNDWHYYLSQGYPLLLTTALPFAILGIYRILGTSSSFLSLSPTARQPLRQLAIICLGLPAALSILSHKEVRFIYPILGPLHVIAAAPAFQFFEPLVLSITQAPNKKSQNKLIPSIVLTVVLSLNLLIAGYTSFIHNSGLIALPDYLHNEFTSHYTSPTNDIKSRPQNMTVAVLMPCHSIPWRAHFLNTPTASHPGIQAWALTCEPPLHLSDPETKKTYLDEADVFYANPTLWLRKNMSRRPPWSYSNLKDHERHHDPGVYVDSNAVQTRNKNLWTSIDSPTDIDTQGLDITDLLPLLRTAPDKPPATETVRRPWPHYLVFFQQLEATLTPALRGSGYTECWRVFNSHWHDDWRRAGDVVVWCLFPDRVRSRPAAGSGLDGVGGREQADSEGGVVPDRPGKQTIIRPEGGIVV